jgi:hypothetical protein
MFPLRPIALKECTIRLGVACFVKNNSMKYIKLLLTTAATLIFAMSTQSAYSQPAMSTEDFLNHLGVNTHLNGLTSSDPWSTDAAQVAEQLSYIGVRLDRDWAWNPGEGKTWKSVQTAWKLGRFWTSIDEASPAAQRRDLKAEETIYDDYPGLIFAMGGPNEEDDDYPQKQGATLPDSTLVQSELFAWANPKGIPVSQMEFGSGWTSANNWEGDYNPNDTGIKQNYTPGPANLGGAHTYISDPNQRPVDVLGNVRRDANLTTPGKPVAHTEMGAYYGSKLATTVYGQYMVMGSFDSAAAGDAAYIVYGLQNSAPEQCYGFYDFPSGSSFPVADYYHTMTSLLKSDSGSYAPGETPTFKPGNLSTSFSNSDTSHLLLQKPTSEYIIADWSEQLMNEKAHDVVDTVGFGRVFASVNVYDIEHGAVPMATLKNIESYCLRMIPGDVYLIELK